MLVDQDVRSALEEFGHNLDVPLVLSDKVRGKARSTIRGATAGEFLQTLCSTNGLTWYFDGNLLYLNASDEISTKLFKANALDLDQLQAYLSNLDVFGQQLSMRNGPRAMKCSCPDHRRTWRWCSSMWITCNPRSWPPRWRASAGCGCSVARKSVPKPQPSKGAVPCP